MRTEQPMAERFWTRVDKTDGCWLWTGKPMGTGYGILSTPGPDRKLILAHRYSAMIHFGMFDSRAYVLHHCDVRLCVNPEHLYVGTHADNMRDMATRSTRDYRPKQCKWGHPLTEPTHYWTRSNGERICQACAKERQKKYRKGGK